MAYDASLKEKWDYYNSLDYMKKEGFDRGMEKGRYEEKLEIARAMKKRGMEQGIIAELLNLSSEEIEKL